MNEAELKDFLTKVHNVRAAFRRRLKDDLTLAENDDVDGADEGFRKDLDILARLRRTQDLEKRFFPMLKRIITQEIRHEDHLGKALAEFVHEQESEGKMKVFSHIYRAFREVENDFQQEDAAITTELESLIDKAA